MGPSSSFQDKVYTKGLNSEAKNKGLPKMKTPCKTLDLVYVQSTATVWGISGRAITSEADLACAALKVQQSNSAFSGAGGKQNPTFLLLLQCP